jgi:hypothetical protein
VSVLVWGWEKNEKKQILVLGKKYCVLLPYTQSTCGAGIKDDFSFHKKVSLNVK